MLRACRRVLRRGGRIGFYTIFIPPGLPEAARRKAEQAAPKFIASRPHMQQELLQRAGFTDTIEIDVSEEFLRVSRAWLEARERYSVQLRKSEGEGQFTERQNERRNSIAAIEAGHLRRSLFIARRS